MRTKGLNIRKMEPEDVEFAIEMAAGEGWNPGIHDGEIFYETDPDGFFIAEIQNLSKIADLFDFYLDTLFGCNDKFGLPCPD